MYTIGRTADCTALDRGSTAGYLDGSCSIKRTAVGGQGFGRGQAGSESTIRGDKRTIIRSQACNRSSVLFNRTIGPNCHRTERTAIEDSLAAGYVQRISRTAKSAISNRHVTAANGQRIAERITIEIQSDIFINRNSTAVVAIQFNNIIRFCIG